MKKEEKKNAVQPKALNEDNLGNVAGGLFFDGFDGFDRFDINERIVYAEPVNKSGSWNGLQPDPRMKELDK